MTDTERELAAHFACLGDYGRAEALRVILDALPEDARLILGREECGFYLTLRRGGLGSEREAGARFRYPEEIALRLVQMGRDYADDRTAEQVAAVLAEGEAAKVAMWGLKKRHWR